MSAGLRTRQQLHGANWGKPLRPVIGERYTGDFGQQQHAVRSLREPLPGTRPPTRMERCSDWLRYFYRRALAMIRHEETR